MSKNIIVDLVSDLNLLISGLEGFYELIPQDENFNCAVGIFIEKVRLDLEKCRQSLFDLYGCDHFCGTGARDETTDRENESNQITVPRSPASDEDGANNNLVAD